MHFFTFLTFFGVCYFSYSNEAYHEVSLFLHFFKEGLTDLRTDGHTDEPTARWTDGQMDKRTDKRTDQWKNRWTDGQTDERTKLLIELLINRFPFPIFFLTS